MSFTALFVLIVIVVVVGLVFWVVWWALGALGLPEPFNKVAQGIVILAVLGFLLLFVAPRLLSLAGAG